MDRDKARVDFVKRYSDLYGAYTEAEVIYTDDRDARAVGLSLTPEDRERFPFDAGDHGLAVLPAGCALPGGDRRASASCPDANARRRPSRSSEREHPVVALFDMEGTIITSNVVESYVWTRMADLPSRRVAAPSS